MTPGALMGPARLAGGRLLRTQSDERLVDLVRAGNVGAFDALVARYRRPLLRHCRRLLPEGQAEDAVQLALLNAYDGLRRSDGHMQLRPWLYRIAHNTSLNALRDRSLSDVELDETIDGVERPDEAFARREALRDTVSAVKGLPERQRDALVLRELEGRSYEEIAGSLGVTDGSVRMLLNRARTTVRSGVTAVTPYGLLARLTLQAGGGADAAGVHAAELGTGAAGGLALKAAATLLVTGAVVGGGATVQHRAGPEAGPAAADAGAQRPPAGSALRVPVADRPEAHTGPRSGGGSANVRRAAGTGTPSKAGDDGGRGSRHTRGGDDGSDHSGGGHGGSGIAPSSSGGRRDGSGEGPKHDAGAGGLSGSSGPGRPTETVGGGSHDSGTGGGPGSGSSGTGSGSGDGERASSEDSSGSGAGSGKALDTSASALPE